MYKMFPITSPASPSHLASYKALRLTSLQLDPQSFASNYTREVAFTDDEWRKRLDSASKLTLIASVHNRDKSNGDVDDGGEWIGTATIVGPSDLPPSALAPFKEAGVGENWAIYGLYAMWVHPDHRGKGVGRGLVDACLEWVRTHIDAKFFDENRDREFEKVVTLLVHKNNIAGQTLYTRAGFVDLEEVASKGGEKWMCVKVD